MTYNTNNPVPSVDVRDLYDNAQNLDSLVNGAATAYPDRLGVSRKSYKGMELDFAAFLASSGFELPALDYVDGTPLVVARPTQLIDRDGILYSVKPSESFPATLAGTWATDQTRVVVRTDQDLRQDLAADDGASLIGLLGRNLSDWVKPLALTRTVESFGATGMGNDTPTLQLAFAWLQGGSGRVLEFSPGFEYIQGPGNVEVVYESNPYYPARFNISDVNSFTLRGNGARIVAAASLADNQFNRGFFFDSCNDFVVEDLEYFGNLTERTPYGGDLFNGGNELTGNRKSGFSTINCRGYMFKRVKSNQTMMDGFSLYKELGSSITGSHDGTFWQCEGIENYRQGMSIISGNNNLILGGSYSDTGTVKGTLPMAGIDIEADSNDWPCTGNVIIGAKLERNHTGLFFSRAAQFNKADNCIITDNRAYGAAFTSNGACRGNILTGGQVTQTQASTQSEKYALYIGGRANKVIEVPVQVADPHRGAVFINLSSTQDCEIVGGEIVDVTPTTAGAFNQVLVQMGANTVRCEVREVSIRDAVGTGQYAVIIDSPTAVFDDNNVSSVHGEAGARGVSVSAAASVSGNRGAGTRLASATDSAVFNLLGSATVVQQMGPNIDEGNPRVGAKLRRKGFQANVSELSQSLDLPSIAANSSYSQDFSVTGSQLGDQVIVTLASPGAIYAVGRVTVAGTVSATFINPTGAAIDRAATTLRIVCTSL